MPNTSAPILAAVPNDVEMSNIVDAPGALDTAIEQFKAQRAAARSALASTLANDLATASLNVDTAIAKEQAWKASDAALAAKIEAAEELKKIFERQIDDLAKNQPEELRTVLHTKIAELEAEVKIENKQTELVRGKIKCLRSLLHHVNESTK